MISKNNKSKMLMKGTGIFSRVFIFSVLSVAISFLVLSCDFGLVDTMDAERFYDKKGLDILSSEKLSSDFLASMDDNEDIYIASGKNLFLLDTSERRLSKLHSFDSDITAMEYHSGKVYTAEEKHVWTYGTASGEFSLILTIEDLINSLYFSDDYFVINVEEDDEYSSSDYGEGYLIRISDYEEVDYASELLSKYYIYCSSLNKFILFNKYPGDYPYYDTHIFESFTLNAGLEVISDSVSDYNYYNNDDNVYRVGIPLKLFPDETKFITKYGNIFDTNDLSFSHDAGFEYNDLVFEGIYIYAVNDTALIKYQATEPYNRISILKIFDDSTPMKIFSGANKLYVLSLVDSDYLMLDEIDL